MRLMKQAISRWLFDCIHTRNLIYNQCWEDPDLDSEVLAIKPEDRIVMITSAGCNALDYLTQNPALIQCIDVNPNQNALLELKLAALRNLRYEQFFDMFGNGRIYGHRRIYHDHLRYRLSKESRAIWDKRIDYFDPDGVGLYYHGTSGLFARSILYYLRKVRGLREQLERFQHIIDLDEQATFYRTHIAPKLWSPMVRFLIRQPAVLSLLGVPRAQIDEIRRSSQVSIGSWIEERVERTLTTIPMFRNYFWRVYLNGYYPDCCSPNYLKREHFEFLRLRASRIQIQTNTITEFLNSTEKQFSIFVLLDHMDWLSGEPSLLEEEWRAIISHALPGARIIYRSGSVSRGYIPQFAIRRLEFESERAEKLHARDRVGTYGSFHFARVTL
jgi:S-adenosylmethionine-diacylglycerol 3-amino-3-carboxypropyl transferase